MALLACSAGEVHAAAHLQFETEGDLLIAHHAVAAVSLDARGQGGKLADALLAEAEAATLKHATAGCAQVVLTGRIHDRNEPSQRMVSRAGWEPRGLPPGTYQDWYKSMSIG